MLHHGRAAVRATAAAWGFIVGALAFAPGCRAPGAHAATRPAVPTEGNAELMEYIGEQAYVTAESAYRAIHILWKGEVFPGEFDALAEALRAGRIIGGSWKHAPHDFVDRAALGYMICRACNIRSGLNWQLTGLGRYAWRELHYRGIVTPSSEYGYVSGGEFLGILARAEDYAQRSGRQAAGRAELGSRP